METTKVQSTGKLSTRNEVKFADKKQPHVSVLQKTFENDVQLRATLAELRKANGNAVLGFAPIGDKHVPKEMNAEIERRIGMEVERNAVRGAGVVYRQCLFNTVAPTPIIDVSAVRKEGNRVKKEFPNAIFKTVFFPVLNGHDLGFGAAIAALVMTGDPVFVPRAQPASPIFPETVWKAEPSSTDIAAVMAAFRSADREIRRLSSVASRGRDKDHWRAVREEAIVQCGLIDLMAPAKRMFDASGAGVEILKHALTGPEARAKRLGKNGISRDELIHQVWRHALAQPRFAPPFVKL